MVLMSYLFVDTGRSLANTQSHTKLQTSDVQVNGVQPRENVQLSKPVQFCTGFRFHILNIFHILKN